MTKEYLECGVCLGVCSVPNIDYDTPLLCVNCDVVVHLRCSRPYYGKLDNEYTRVCEVCDGNEGQGVL